MTNITDKTITSLIKQGRTIQNTGTKPLIRGKQTPKKQEKHKKYLAKYEEKSEQHKTILDAHKQDIATRLANFDSRTPKRQASLGILSSLTAPKREPQQPLPIYSLKRKNAIEPTGHKTKKELI